MYPRRLITTEEVQGQYLDENERLFTEIMEMIKLGKLDECAEHQERLQQNLMYLAAIADWQQPLTPPEWTLPLDLPEAVVKAQEHAIFLANVAIQFDNPQHQQHKQTQENGFSPQNLSLQFDNPQDQLNQQAKEQGFSPPNLSLQFGNPLHQLHHQDWQQGIFSLMRFQFGNSLHQPHQQAQKQGILLQDNRKYPMHSEYAFGADSSGGQTSTSGQNDALGRSVQGTSEGGDGQGKLAAALDYVDLVSYFLHD